MSDLMLDLTNAELPTWWPDNDPKKIPIRKGRWSLDYDVVEEEMPVGWKGRMWMIRKRLGFQLGKEMVYPIGFDISSLPKGALILNNP